MPDPQDEPELGRPSALPRRAFLGVGLRDRAGALEVSRVVAGSMADRAGVRIGDALLAVDRLAVRSVDAVRAAVRGASETVRLTLRRDGRTRDLEAATLPFPTEVVPGAQVRLGEVSVKGARLRTIVTVPDTPPPHPAVLFLSGVRCEPIEHPLDPDAPVARVIRGLSDGGFLTLRLERSGIGDSEGPPCCEVGFVDEHAGYAAALESLTRHSSVDPAAVFAFGHSVGGMHAALLAADHPLRGVIAYGSCAQRWSRCLRDGMARQLGLRGLAPDAIDEALRAFDAAFPDARHGRSAGFHRELDAVDLEAAWSATDAPLAVLAGEHDWVVGLEAQRSLAARSPRAELVVLDGLDHAFGRHASLDDSLRDYGRGIFDPRLVEAAVSFARGVLQGRQGA